MSDAYDTEDKVLDALFMSRQPNLAENPGVLTTAEKTIVLAEVIEAAERTATGVVRGEVDAMIAALRDAVERATARADLFRTRCETLEHRCDTLQTRCHEAADSLTKLRTELGADALADSVVAAFKPYISRQIEALRRELGLPDA